MADSSKNHINFEEWSTLASTDPEKFEQLRKDKIANFIRNANKERQQRLKGLQWQIDRTRDKHKGSSVASCIAISKLMWQTFYQLSDTLQSHAKNEPLDIRNVPAKILSFPEKATN